MALQKSDVILLLSELQEKGFDVNLEMNMVITSKYIPLEILKFINENKSLDAVRFYDKLRDSYNKKRSKLYINIMRSDENTITDAKTILTTLSALLNQILQFEAEDRPMFLRVLRAEEISDVLKIYFQTFNIGPAYKLLTLFKADCKCLEAIK